MGTPRNRLYSPDDLVQIYDDTSITAHQLLKEWPSCSELYLSRIIDAGLLNSFEIRDSFEDTKGKLYYRCLKIDKIQPIPSVSDNPAFDWKHKVFFISEIKAYEVEHPILKHKPIDLDDIQNGPHDYIPYFKKEPDEWISAEKVRQQLKISPFKFRELLERAYFETEMEEARQLHYEQVGCYGPCYFEQPEIPFRSIHVSSYKTYCEQNNLDPYLLPDRQPKPPTPPVAYTSELAESRKRVEELEAENERLKEQLEEMEKQSNRTSKQPAKAAVLDYEERIPEIVDTTLSIYEYWNASGENSPIRKHGFSDKEIEAITNTTKKFRVAIKRALPEQGVKAWLENRPRPSS